jgi:hypothetical protein
MNTRCCGAAPTAYILESRYSSEIQFGSLTNAELGALELDVFTVAHLAVPAQVAPTVADQPAGSAGVTTKSKFSTQDAEQLIILTLAVVVNTGQPPAAGMV